MAITKITRDALNTGIDDNSDATAITIDSSERVGVGAAPNATFGSLLYTQGTPAANKPIISGYSRVTRPTQDWRYSTTLEIVASGLMAPRCASHAHMRATLPLT